MIKRLCRYSHHKYMMFNRTCDKVRREVFRIRCMKCSRINPVSKKRAMELRQEAILKQGMLNECGGYCMLCGRLPDFRGLSKHEIVFRSHGGSPTDRSNCIILCQPCHSRQNKSGYLIMPNGEARDG